MSLDVYLMTEVAQWGNYEGLVSFVTAYLKACQTYPDANVEVSR